MSLIVIDKRGCWWRVLVGPMRLCVGTFVDVRNARIAAQHLASTIRAAVESDDPCEISMEYVLDNGEVLS